LIGDNALAIHRYHVHARDGNGSVRWILCDARRRKHESNGADHISPLQLAACPSLVRKIISSAMLWTSDAGRSVRGVLRRIVLLCHPRRRKHVRCRALMEAVRAITSGRMSIVPADVGRWFA
jgi:hypothetical protein